MYMRPYRRQSLRSVGVHTVLGEGRHASGTGRIGRAHDLRAPDSRRNVARMSVFLLKSEVWNGLMVVL